MPAMTNRSNGLGAAVDMLFAAQPFTGLEHHALHVLRGLRAAGAAVDVWVSRNVALSLGEAAAGHRLVPFPPPPRPLRLGWEQWVVPWRFGTRPRSYRLLHAITGVAPMLTRLTLVLTVPDLTYRMSPKDLHPRARLYFGTLVPASIRRAARIITSSEAVRQDVMSLYHIPPDRVTCIPLCADPIFTPQPDATVRAVRKRFLLPERYILYVGTIDSRKDLPRLRAAYDLLPEDLSDVALVFAGRTAHGAAMLARELCRTPRRGYVRMLDYVPQSALPALYGGASLLAYPSRYEGFGLPVLEAMACGTPVIVSSTPALRELVGDAGTVLMTAAVEELTQAMERLLRFEADHQRLKVNGLARAAGYTLDRLGRQTLSVYEEVVAA